MRRLPGLAGRYESFDPLRLAAHGCSNRGIQAIWDEDPSGKLQDGVHK